MTGPVLTVLIVGGYGVFGGRLARLLANEDRLTLIIAGRSVAKAEAFVAALPSRAALKAAAFDRDGDAQAQLRALGPDIVVDATGPFQAYGAEPYRLVEAAVALGIDYLDFADGSEFVSGVARFDDAAKARGVAVLSGVSSFPVLTAAVVRHLAEGLACVDSIAGGIAPSPFAGVGLNVIRAIASYAGKPVALTRNGVLFHGNALTETRRATICPPGALPLRNTLFALVDVPDLQLIPPLWPGLGSIWMGAGPVPEGLHRLLIWLAWLVRLGIVPTLEPLAPLFYRVINLLRWGEHRGGMFVAIEGRDAAGARMSRSWHMLAEGEDGPFIPSMAIEAIVRRRLDGNRPEPGARAAVAELELADYERLFAKRTITTGRWELTPQTATLPLYRRALGEAWETLPEPVRAMHTLSGERVARGRAQVDGADTMAGRLIAWVIGFPQPGRDVPVEVRMTADASGRETWRRTFGGRRFESSQAPGTGRWERLIVERFGPFAFGLAVVVRERRLELVVRGWSLIGVPLPLGVAPRGSASESAEAARFRFDVDIRLPAVGRLVRYRGWLEAVDMPTRFSAGLIAG